LWGVIEVGWGGCCAATYYCCCVLVYGVT